MLSMIILYAPLVVVNCLIWGDVSEAMTFGQTAQSAFDVRFEEATLLTASMFLNSQPIIPSSSTSGILLYETKNFKIYSYSQVKMVYWEVI